MTYLTHIALTDGACERSFSEREALPAYALQWARDTLRLVLDEGSAPVPQFGPRWQLTGERLSSKALLCSISNGDAVAITFGAAAHSRAGAKLWRTLNDSRLPCPPEPWIASRLDSGPLPERARLIEHSIAWAFLELIDEEKTNAR